jgi:hypothetical protein
MAAGDCASGGLDSMWVKAGEEINDGTARCKFALATRSKPQPKADLTFPLFHLQLLLTFCENYPPTIGYVDISLFFSPSFLSTTS